MGIGTFLIGCLPTYASIGTPAPALLTLLRVVQGIGVGGRVGWLGAAVDGMGSTRRRGLMASWPQLGVPIGLLLSTGMVTLVSSATGSSFTTRGWRIPFLTSVVLVAVGLYVRLRVPETPDFTQLVCQAAVVEQPVRDALRICRAVDGSTMTIEIDAGGGVTCPRCSSVNRAGDQFCTRCGEAIAEQASQPPAPLTSLGTGRHSIAGPTGPPSVSASAQWDATTRYLCAAVHLDSDFSDAAIAEFLVEPFRAIPPRQGLTQQRYCEMQ